MRRARSVGAPDRAAGQNELLLPLRTQNVFIVMLVDLFDVGGTLIDNFHSFVGATAAAAAAAAH